MNFNLLKTFENRGTIYSQVQVDFSDPKVKEFNILQKIQKDLCEKCRIVEFLM